MRDRLSRLGGPNGISFIAWLILAPISVLFTHEVVPEGYHENFTQLNGYLVGAIGHGVTGLVIWLGKLLFLRNVNLKPRPITTLLIFAVAGALRGVAVAYAMEALQITYQSDYSSRIRSGVVLVVIWFALAGLMSDARISYRTSYRDLMLSIEQQLQLRTMGQELIATARDEIIAQIKQTLSIALKRGSKTGDIHLAVDDLVRPLSHRLTLDAESLIAPSPTFRRRIKLVPVLKTAIYKTPLYPLEVAIVAVAGTVLSRIWALGWLGLLVSIVDFFVISLLLGTAKKLGIRGPHIPLVWLATGLLTSLIADWLANPTPLSDPTAVVYFSVNVVIPALLFSLLEAYNLEARRNLELLKTNLISLTWETDALKQRAWVERKRLARFIHSDLQSRLRAFALRLNFAGQEPTESQLEDLRKECEEALVFDDEQQSLAGFFEGQHALWKGVAEVRASCPKEISGLLERDRYATAAVIETVREGTTNAVKHGRAKHVNIDFALKPEGPHQTLTVTVSDDGESPNQKNPGLGHKTLREFASNVSFESTAEGAVLEVRIPVNSINE
jgi:signal transduction histidine kinase